MPFVPLAGLEPAACCLGDVSAWTLCSAALYLVVSDRGPKVIVSSLQLEREPSVQRNDGGLHRSRWAVTKRRRVARAPVAQIAAQLVVHGGSLPC
jgi:hypothetical protein